MVKELSYGIIPLSKKEGEWKVLLVKHLSGHWSFPKGHAEASETPIESAVRELKEETGLHLVKMLSDEILFEHYKYRFRGEPREKTVTFFIAEVEGELVIQSDELFAGKWVPLKSAHTYVTFAEVKSLCNQVCEILKV